MLCRTLVAALIVVAATGCVATMERGTTAESDVAAAETAFAATMANRDFAAFARFIADDAVFIGAAEVQRGRAQVLDAWRRYFDGEDAPFSWAPALVVASDDGRLALSTGPVYAPSGECSGTFTSIWRRQPNGEWLVVFDRGSRDCGER